MTIWVDADAAPREVKEILIRASQKRQVTVVFVANRVLNLPRTERLQMIKVEQGPDVADDYIADHCERDDLVISADVPLAARVVEKGGTILQPRGRVLDAENVEEALSVRDFGESLRATGIETGGPPPFKPIHKQKFSNALDRWLTLHRH